MNLLSVQGTGAMYSAIVLLICIIIVHAFKLVRLGYRTLGKKLPAEKPPKPQKESEPVYFIVERKKRRSKSEFSDPKRISFK